MPAEKSQSAVVITPTIGRSQLKRCVESVSEQNYPNVRHLVVCDGPSYFNDVRKICDSATRRVADFDCICLPQNTGLNRYNGYRICSAFSFLVNEDVVFFLDDDNWYESDHVTSCIAAMQQYDTDWSYGLRTICNSTGDFLLFDDCDSLGFWKRSASYLGPVDNLEEKFATYLSSYPFLVDMNCFGIRRGTLVQIAGILLDGDGAFSNYLVRNVAGACTGKRSVNYRVPKRLEKIKIEYFASGNERMRILYKELFPWKKNTRCEPLSLVRTQLEDPRKVASRLLADSGSNQRKDLSGIPQHPDRPELLTSEPSTLS